MSTCKFLFFVVGLKPSFLIRFSTLKMTILQCSFHTDFLILLIFLNRHAPVIRLWNLNIYPFGLLAKWHSFFFGTSFFFSKGLPFFFVESYIELNFGFRTPPFLFYFFNLEVIFFFVFFFLDFTVATFFLICSLM